MGQDFVADKYKKNINIYHYQTWEKYLS